MVTREEMLETHLAKLNAGGACDYRVASGGGRMITTMDRYNANWSVVERGWKAHVLGIGRPFASAREAVETYYTEDPKSTDQYLESFVITENGKPVGTIEDGDAVIVFNFRETAQSRSPARSKRQSSASSTASARRRCSTPASCSTTVMHRFRSSSSSSRRRSTGPSRSICAPLA